jgi:predicted RNA-binding Zn-ribbon protein involved in translation (DUF1610 family)
MASSYYCPHCGNKNIYELTKPKFCASCGKELAVSIIAKTSATTPNPSPRVTPTVAKSAPRREVEAHEYENNNDDDFDEGGDQNEGFDYSTMKSLAFVVDKRDSRTQIGTLEDLINSPTEHREEYPANKAPKAPAKRGRPSKKQIPDFFIQEASNVRIDRK